MLLFVRLHCITYVKRKTSDEILFFFYVRYGAGLFICALLWQKKTLPLLSQPIIDGRKKSCFFFFSLLHCRNPSLIALHSLSHVSLFSLVDYFRLTPTIDITGRYFYFLGRKERHSYHRLMKISSKHFLI